jgi:hypothetical protein
MLKNEKRQMNTENSMAIENSVSVRLSNVFGLQVVQ